MELVESFYEFYMLCSSKGYNHRQRMACTTWRPQRFIDSTSGKSEYAINNFTSIADLGDDVEDCVEIPRGTRLARLAVKITGEENNKCPLISLPTISPKSLPPSPTCLTRVAPSAPSGKS